MYSVYVVTWISVDRINLLAFPFLLPSQKIFSCNCYYLASSLAGVNKTQSKGLFSQMKATLFSLRKVQNCNAFFANFCLNLFHKCYHLKVRFHPHFSKWTSDGTLLLPLSHQFSFAPCQLHPIEQFFPLFKFLGLPLISNLKKSMVLQWNQSKKPPSLC